MKAIRKQGVIWWPVLGLVIGVLAIRGWIEWKSSAASRVPDTTENATGHMPPWHHGLIHGTKGDDVLYGTEAAERIEGLAGRDVIIARGGNDELDGGPDSDTLLGGPGDDTYIVQHHGGGSDVIIEESGTDTLRFAGGHVDLASIQILRHGDDLIVRSTQGGPEDAVLIRSWFLGPQYHVERLQLSDGTVVPLEPLAERASTATVEDLIHFAGRAAAPSPPGPSGGPGNR